MPMRVYRNFLLTLILSVPALCSTQTLPDNDRTPPVIDESFEGELPNLHKFQASYSAAASQANTGGSSLLITPETGKWGGAYFRLVGKLVPGKSYEFTAAVHVSEGGRASLYISGIDGTTRRVFATTSGGVTGKWTTLKGLLRNTDWKGNESDIMLAMVTNAPTYYDDVRLVEIITLEPPSVSWPKAIQQLKDAASGMAKTLNVGQTLTLKARHGVLSSNLGADNIQFPGNVSQEIAADGAMVFAFDLPKGAIVSGAIELKHTGNLRPGLRAYVLIDSILTAAPMVSSAPWSNPGRVINRPAPDIAGREPSSSIALSPCTLRAGRHYLIIAGPHTRAAGDLAEINLQAKPVKASPLYTFALFTDMHLGEGRSEWMNTKLAGPVVSQLKHTLAELRDEATDFIFLGGDMVESGTTSQYSSLRDVIEDSKMSFYGVMGNHETFQPTSRTDCAKFLKNIFPGGETYYAFSKAPLRFIVLDKSYWRNTAGAIMEYPAEGFSASTINSAQVDWLRTTLEADKQTPTVILCHFPVFANPSISSSGYEIVSWAIPDKSTELLAGSPNVIAVLNGHTHWSQVGKFNKITWIQNAAFVEWPSMYRVFRVYPDRLEWETRLVSNLGFLRESIIPDKCLSWMISTGPADLAGTVRFH